MSLRNPKCEDCGLYKTAQYVCLQGQGSIPSKIMVVGEAPGFREDDTGKPFQGKSGELLDELLEGVGLSREKVYITNAVHCRPPDNRTPTKKEITACSKYLQAEIKAVKPKFVLVLGSVAMQGTLNKSGVTKHRGEIMEKDGVKYFITLHPAALFRQPQQIPYVKSDFERFSHLIKGNIGKDLRGFNWTLVNSMSELRKCLYNIKDATVVSYDGENSGLNPLDPTFKCYMLGIGQENKQWVIPLSYPGSNFRNPRVQSKIMEALEHCFPEKLVAQNGKYDNKVAKAQYGWDIEQTFDTMLASYILDENAPHGLKPMSKMFYNAPDYAIPQPVDPTKYPLEQVAEYCAMDVYYTLKLYHMFKEKLLEDKQLLRVFKYLLMPASKMLEDAELEGVYVDKEGYAEAVKTSQVKVNEALKKLEGYAKINWNSTQQVASFLFTKLKLPILEVTAKGAPSTSSESVLPRLRDSHPVISVLITYREQIKLQQFLTSWSKFLDKNHKMHPNFKLHGTVTGRLSCKDPNLQQVPRDVFIRSLITAPPGWEFGEADYSQAELRLTAEASGDRAMKHTFQTGKDIHIRTASTVMSVSEKDVNKDHRKKAKAVNFGFVYGMSSNKFKDYARDKYGVDLTDEEAVEFRRRFFDLYCDLPSWHERQRRLVRKHKYVRSLYFGRKRRLPEVDSPEKKIRAEAERQAINSPIQGSASDLNLFSGVRIHQEMSPNDIRVVGLVHDAILFIFRPERKERILTRVHELMTDMATVEKVFKTRVTVPIEIEIKVGPWGKGKVWEPQKS